MNNAERAVAAALQQIASDVPPVRIPPDLWARGRRRRQLQAVAATVSVAALLVAMIALPLAWLPQPHPAGPAESERAIPSRIRIPMPLQPNLVDAPNGPASVIATGPGGSGASDVFGFDDRALVVGRDGLYRYVRDINSVNAGEDLLLSPDGRYLAGPADLEGVDFDESASNWKSTAGVMDLSTGKVRTYHDGAPVTWSPDSRLILSGSFGQLTLLDVGSGEKEALDIGGRGQVEFSSEGHQLAQQQAREFKILDLDTRVERTVAGLDAQQTLAGPGAWNADAGLAVWNDSDCRPACPAGYRDFRLSFVNVDNGAQIDARFDTVQAASARLLGWQTDGDAVVVLNMTSHDPTGPTLGAPQVLALHPGGGQTTLITLPAAADRIDVARNLLDHFGGDPRPGWTMFLDLLGARLPHAILWLAAIAAIIGIRLTYRRLRARGGTVDLSVFPA